MEKQVIFRQYQQQLEEDHNNVQTFARQSLDHVVNDAVTKTRRYAGCLVTKSDTAEITIAPGRFYDINGAIYNRSVATPQSMISYLPTVAKKIVVVSAYGIENETDVQTRDYITDLENETIEPDEQAMTRSRDLQLAFTAGSESADPQAPSVSDTHVKIAEVLLDATQVVSVTMITENEVESTEDLHARAKSLETFREQLEPRITSISQEIAGIKEGLDDAGDDRALSDLFADMARVKEVLEIPDTAVDYGADRFLTPDESDTTDSQSLGYSAKVQEGVRFPDANSTVFEPALFSTSDPNAKLSSGLLLPSYTDDLKLAIVPYHSSIGIGQYGYDTHSITRRTVSRERLRYGDVFSVCTNSRWWRAGNYDPVTETFQRDGETFEVVSGDPTRNHRSVRLRQVWRDTYTEHYWDHVVTTHIIDGAQVAETLLVPNDMWLTKIGFWLQTKAAAENIHITLCELTAGQPDLSKAILQHTVDEADLTSGGWVRTGIHPTFIRGGRRYALVFTSNANHELGMAQGQQYIDGTFFYTTDGAYFQGDLTKDLMIELWGAKFDAPNVTIELEAWNLDGGIRYVDILAGTVVPGGCDLIWEVQPNGSGAWYALTSDDLTAFAGTPPLCRARVRFIGTRDVMPGLVLNDTEVKLARPDTSFVHISDSITLGAAATTVTVELMVENFDDTPHDVGCRLRSLGVWEDPDVTATETLDAAAGRYRKKYTFNIPSSDTFSIEITGATNSAGNTFHVAERVHYA